MNHLVCTQCPAHFPDTDIRWRCECGGLLDLECESKFDFDEIATRPADMWRYREAIPLRSYENSVSLQEGFTPLSSLELDGKNILVKQDHLFPTGSYKDRGASVLISKAKELGVDYVVEDSSGNAGCAIAAYCASAGIECEIFVPESTSPAKLKQIEAYGAKLNLVPGDREATANAAMEAAQYHFYASHSWNPYFFHGTKTFAFEVCEQLRWQAPDAVIVPVGNGTLLLGCEIGFRELLADQVIEKIPKLIGIQASGCAPLFQAFHSDAEDISEIQKQETKAEGIAIAEPVRARQILAAVRSSGGTILAVEDHETLSAHQDMARIGHYIEPTSAATIAGARQYLQSKVDDEVIVTTFTGHGLKYQ